MGRPLTVDDNTILAAARALLRTNGCSTTLEDVARDVGLSGAAVFKRFGSKEALMLEALRPLASLDWLDLVRAGPSDRPVPQQLIELSVKLAAWMDDVVPAMAILKAAGHEPARVLAHYDMPGPRDILMALAGWLREATERSGLAVADPVVGAMLWLGSLQIRAFMSHLSPGRDPVISAEFYAQAVAEQLLDGWLAGPD